jgi:hypothetical protein
MVAHGGGSPAGTQPSRQSPARAALALLSQTLELSEDLAADWFLALWHQVPTPAKAAKVRKATIANILRTHHIRRLEAGEVLRILHQKPLCVAPETVAAASAHIRIVMARLRLVNGQIRAAHRKLDELCARLEAAAPSEPGQPAEPLRRRDYHALRALSGVAPVTRRSGKTCIVIRRLACNQRLARTLYHWARVASQHEPVSQRRYAELRRRGHSHGRALRTIGDRLLFVACTLLQRQTLFDPDHLSHKAAA